MKGLTVPGKETPGLAISSPDRPLQLLSPSPLNSEDLTHSAFYLPQYIPVPSACCHRPHIYQAGLGVGVAGSRDKTCSGLLSSSLEALGPGQRLRHSSLPSHHFPREGVRGTRLEAIETHPREPKCHVQVRTELKDQKEAPSLLAGSSEAMRPSPHEPGAIHSGWHLLHQVSWDIRLALCQGWAAELNL